MRSEYTKKLYYKKYGHRLVINVRAGHQRRPAQPTAEVVSWLLERKYQGAFRSITSYSWETKKNHCTVFFKDPELFEYLKSSVGEEYLEEYERPMDGEHLELLTSEKVVTRKSLFYNKYRIAVRVKCGWHTKNYQEVRQSIKEMSQWCRDQFGPEYNNDRWALSDWTNANYYFRDTRDAVLFKMSHQTKCTTERVMLLSEVEARTKEA